MTNWNHVGYQLKEPLTCGHVRDFDEGVARCQLDGCVCWLESGKDCAMNKKEEKDSV